MYSIHIPKIFRNLYAPNLCWEAPATAQDIYLTFDDGPHPCATPFVLEQLQKFDAKGTFFCLGKNVIEYGDVYRQMLAEGHVAGNHTQSHPNGFKTANNLYLQEVDQASKHIQSNLFRPPYGAIRRAQAAAIRAKGFEIIMWTALSGDFDTKISGEKCFQNVTDFLRPGAIIVFHDSAKAWDRLKVALPATLERCAQLGLHCKPLSADLFRKH